MTTIEIPYGKTRLSATVPESVSITQLAPAQIDAAPDPVAAVEQALNQTMGDTHLSDFADIETVAIAINDKTRPVPHHHLLPPLLTRLEGMGIDPENILLIIATGTHPVMPPDEYPRILPQDIIDRYPIICHDGYDAENLVEMGTTSRGTPVFVNRHYLAADLHIVVGNIEPHQFQGYSGGAKSAAIGLAGAQTINHNHAMMTHDHARFGEYNHNPARQDVEEIGRMIRVDFAHNALLNGDKAIVEVYSGAPEAVMQAAIPRVKQIFLRPVDAPFDLMIVSPGGYPKDINVYQAQKGLAHAAAVIKPGGTVILCAACPEGSGSEKYENWLFEQDVSDHAAVIERFKSQGFRVGPHKAFQISRDAARLNLMTVTDMDPDYARRLLLNPVADLQSALDSALTTLPESARIGVMPVANATMPAPG